MISIVQNFICTKPERLEVLKNETPHMGKIFKDSTFYINYNTSKNLDEVHKIYKDNIIDLNFYNNLEPNWGLVTLSLLKEVTTPYTLILCEDFVYKMDYKYWNNIMKEVIHNNISYMPLGRLWKYNKQEYLRGYEEGNLLWKYNASDSPGSSLSVDALYKTEMLIGKLENLISYNSRRFPLNLPHHFEDIYHEPNGVRLWGKDIVCAIPKKEIFIHTQPETETFLNK
jgi:hypothetical protein|tara:strand:+ start:85 stop:765 length:681 start_codon:yes stop_codon:yes gene_type:complete